MKTVTNWFIYGNEKYSQKMQIQLSLNTVTSRSKKDRAFTSRMNEYVQK